MVSKIKIISLIKDAKVSTLKNVNIRQITVDDLKIKIMETKDKITIKHDKELISEDVTSIYELKKIAAIIYDYVNEYKRKIIKKRNKEYVSKLFKLLRDKEVVHFVLSYVKQHKKHADDVMEYIEKNIKVISVIKNPKRVMYMRKKMLNILKTKDHSVKIEKFVEDFINYLENKINNIGSLFDAFENIKITK